MLNSGESLHITALTQALAASAMASVFLADLDGDWVASAQACTNPIFADAKPTVDKGDRPSKKVSLTLEGEDDPTAAAAAPAIVQPDLIRSSGAAGGRTKATVSLSDCLACSGCVTSAEAVLVTQQSSAAFTEVGNLPCGIIPHFFKEL